MQSLVKDDDIRWPEHEIVELEQDVRKKRRRSQSRFSTIEAEIS